MGQLTAVTSLLRAACGDGDRLPAVQGRERVLLLARVRAAALLACSSRAGWRRTLTHARAADASCRRCDGTGKLTCNKCRGYGYLKKGPDDKCVCASLALIFRSHRATPLPSLARPPCSVKAFKQAGQEDTSNIYLCPFCKGTGTRDCEACRGAAKLWPNQLNVHRLFKWRHVHQNAAERRERELKTGVNVSKEEAKRKIQTGLGGFKMSGSANLLPLTDEELAQQAADKK